MKRALFGLAMIGTACTDVFAPVAPAPFVGGDATGLQFHASVSRPRLVVGDTATVILVLRNPTNRRVALNFDTACQIMPFVKRGRVQVHPEVPFGCPGAETRLVINDSAEHVIKLPFRAISGQDLTAYGVLTLTPSAYVAYGELMNGEGRSTSVDFVVER